MTIQAELTLFQRLKLGEEGTKKQVTINPDTLRRSIGQHLQNMFNTRQGASSANADYGLPDFNDLDMSNGFSSAINEIKKSIKQHLDQYESRLNGVRVNYLEDPDDPLNLRFEIRGRLNLEGHSGRVRFEASMKNDGAVKVST